MEKEVKSDLPPDDLRCKRSDGRHWRCKRPALPGKSLCQPHLHRCSSKKSPRITDNGVVTSVSTPESGPSPSPSPCLGPNSMKIRIRVKPDFVLEAPPFTGLDPLRPVIALPAAHCSRGTVQIAREEDDITREGTVIEAVAREKDEVPSEVVASEVAAGEAALPSTDLVVGEEVARNVVKGGPSLVLEGEEGALGVVEGAPETGLEGKVVEGAADTSREDAKVVARERVKEAAPDHIRCHRNDGRTWRCKREVVEGQNLCVIHFTQSKIKSASKGSTTPKVGRPRMKRPLINDLDDRGNGNGAPDDVAVGSTSSPMLLALGQRKKRSAVCDVEERDREREARRCSRDSGRGWRCERPAKEGYLMCEEHLAGGKEKKSAGKKTGLQKSKKKEKRGNSEADMVAEKVPDALRCTRNDGKDWRCKRRVVDGQELCGAHFKGVELKDVETDEVQNPVKKKRKKTMEKEICKLIEVKQEVGVDEDEGNQLAMVADVAVAEAERREGGKGDEEELLRCKRTDGRGWRCKRRVVEGKTLCEIHYEQGKLRQKRITVPESMKIRGDAGGDKVEKRLKRKRALAILENNSDKGMKRMKAELIRVFLRREILEQNKKTEKEKGSVGNNGNGEVTRDLPYGVMAIPPAPPAQILGDAGSLGIKVGVHSSNSLVKRRFRSENIEPPPTGAVKTVPFAGNVGKVKYTGKRKCHWCRYSDKSSLIKCVSCSKRFFCINCIKQRNTDPDEVKLKCPVCRGCCDCKACLSSLSKELSTKGILHERCEGSKLQQLQYLINLLLPILEQINEEQNFEAETEAKLKGQNISEVPIRYAEVGCRDQCSCNNCKSLILDIHRSCPNCSYNLCLSCYREYSQGGYPRVAEASSSKYSSVKSYLPGMRLCSEKISKSSSARCTGLAVVDSLSDSTPCFQISCPPMELGGCDNSLLDLRCIFPLNWTKELEISAKETVPVEGSPQTVDDSVPCSLCSSVAQVANEYRELEEVSRRTESHDNFLYCPSSSDDRHIVLYHFQKHWRKGHPVKIRNVIQSTSTLSWDPLAMFCSYLETDANDSVNMKDPIEAVNCSGWFDVESGTRESFAHSLEEGYVHRRHETIRVKAKLSPTFSQRLLDGRYNEIIQALPLQEYTNPRSGLLNITGKLPEDFPVFELGPHVYISFGSPDILARGELVTKLHFDSYDVVNILVHAGDAPCTATQMSKIKKLMRRSSMKDKWDQSSRNLEKEEARMQSEISVEAAGQENVLQGTELSLRIGDNSCSATANGAPAVMSNNDESPTKVQSSDSEICSGANDSPHELVQVWNIERVHDSTILTDQSRASDTCGTQWDVFRRKDVPKLLEYIVKHVDELSFSFDLPKNVVHPLFDGSFYLNAAHKLQLKEEFDIEPWTFKQSVGEAVFIPAGCPYQTRNLKTCINVTVGFISPENAAECIKLINEIRLLPNNHKAKQVKLEVEKMTICSLDEAIKEIYRLKSEEANHPKEGVLLSTSNS